MIRRILLSSALVLLTSCAQPVVGPVPSVPTTLSTNLADAAGDVVADRQGNAYVLGYRNQAVNTDVNSGGEALPAELFVGQFSKAGVLNWLTVLRTDQLDELRYTSSVVATDTAVYALNQARLDKVREQPQPVYLHKLEFGGTLLWSKVILEDADYVSSLFSSPNGQLYLQYSEASSDSSYVSLLDAEGTVQWSKKLPGELLGVGDDGGLYLSGTQRDGTGNVTSVKLQKYNVNGVPLWSRDVAPSVPYSGEPSAGPFVQLETRGTDLYVLTEFFRSDDPSRGDVGNTEVRHYTADGVEIWSRFLYPVETGSLAHSYTTFPAGITSGADLYLLVESTTFDNPGAVRQRSQQLHRFFIDGQHTNTALETSDGSIENAALVPSGIKEVLSLPQVVFYSVGKTGKDVETCTNSVGLSKPCVYTDAVTSSYTVDGASDQTALYTHLEWSSR